MKHLFSNIKRRAIGNKLQAETSLGKTVWAKEFKVGNTLFASDHFFGLQKVIEEKIELKDGRVIYTDIYGEIERIKLVSTDDLELAKVLPFRKELKPFKLAKKDQYVWAIELVEGEEVFVRHKGDEDNIVPVPQGKFQLEQGEEITVNKFGTIETISLDAFNKKMMKEVYESSKSEAQDNLIGAINVVMTESNFETKEKLEFARQLIYDFDRKYL